MNSLGTILKEARSKTGLTLRQVEDSSGVSNAYLSQLENDKIKSPSANILYKLSSLYNIPLNLLLKGAGIIEGHVEETSTNNSFINRVAFSSEGLTEEEKQDVLQYLEFLKTKKSLL